MRAASPVRSIDRDAPVTIELADRASSIRYQDLPAVPIHIRFFRF